MPPKRTLTSRTSIRGALRARTAAPGVSVAIIAVADTGRSTGDENHFTQEWVSYANGKEAEKMVLTMTRKS